MKRLLAALFVVLASPAFAGQAIPVNEFLSSLGVNTHMTQGYPESAYEKEFIYTGIRNTRDGSRAYQSLITLHNNTKTSTYPGVKANIVGSPSSVIARAVPLANAGALLSIEGPNEPNNFPITYNGVKGGDNVTWVPVAQFQRDLYAAVKGNATLMKYPVFGVSETGAETDNVGLQCLVLDSTCAGASGVTLMAAGTRYADYANPHNYVQGNGGCHTPSPNQAWNAEDPTLKSCWDGIYGDNVLTWNKHFPGYSVAQAMNLARVTSETGWISDSPSLDYQGKVLLNVYLDAFKRGWAYTFVYEMVDAQGSSSNQGFYTSTNVAKPSATYVHNMTTILADTTNFSAGSLGYSVANEPATVHDMLLQKSNGTYYLAIWDEHTAPQYTDRVTVTLSQAATVTEYDPTRGTVPIATFTNVTSVPLTLSDHVVFLVIP